LGNGWFCCCRQLGLPLARHDPEQSTGNDDSEILHTTTLKEEAQSIFLRGINICMAERIWGQDGTLVPGSLVGCLGHEFMSTSWWYCTGTVPSGSLWVECGG
jgi:hypothetical protein